MNTPWEKQHHCTGSQSTRYTIGSSEAYSIQQHDEFNGYRYYTDTDLERITVIMGYRATGIRTHGVDPENVTWG